jgi:hypothetical protein
MRLAAYARKRDGSLEPVEVQMDDRCELGKWIHGEARLRYSRWTEYDELKQAHAEFHKAAAGVVRSIDAGAYNSEETALGGSSQYSQSSRKCVTAILALKRKLGA